MVHHIQQYSDELHLLEADLQPQAPKRFGFRVLAAVGVSGLLGAALLATRGFHPFEGYAARTRGVVGEFADGDDTPCEVKFCSSFNVSLCPADRPLLVANADLVKGECADDCCAKACSSFDVKKCPATKPALVRDTAKVIGSSPFTCCAPYEVSVQGGAAVTIDSVCDPGLYVTTGLPACCDPVVTNIFAAALTALSVRFTPETLKEVLTDEWSVAESRSRIKPQIASLLQDPANAALKLAADGAILSCLADVPKVLTGLGQAAPGTASALFTQPDVRVNSDGTQPVVLLTGDYAVSGHALTDLIPTFNFKDALPEKLAAALGTPVSDITVAVAANIVDNVGTHFFGMLTPDSDVPINCAPGPQNLDLRCAKAMQGPAVSLLFNTLGPDLVPAPPATISVSIVDGTNPSAAPKELLVYDSDLHKISFHPSATEVISATDLKCDKTPAPYNTCEHWFLASVDPVKGAFLYYIYQDKLQLLGSKPAVKAFNLASFYSKPVVHFSKGVGVFVAADKSKSALESLR